MKLSPEARKQITAQLFEWQKGICPLCNQSLEMGIANNIDHIIPASRGGPDVIDNFQLTHAVCNTMKANEHNWPYRPNAFPMLIKKMGFKDYLEDPCPVPSVSSSTVRRILESAPARVWHETRRLNPDWEDDEGEKKFEIGTAAHAQLIGEGEPIVEIPHDSYRSNAAKELRAEAYEAGHTPVLSKDIDRVIDMADAALLQMRQNDECREVLESDPIREGTIIWNDAGVICRCRPDLFIVNSEMCIIVHYKTTGTILNFGSLPRFAANQSWELIAAHYDAGMRAMYGLPVIQVFAIQETKRPHQMIIGELQEQFVEIGEMRRQRALEVWARCVRSGNWPGHDAKTFQIQMPAWHEKSMIEAKDREESRKLGGKDMTETSFKLQSAFAEDSG